MSVCDVRSLRFTCELRTQCVFLQSLPHLIVLLYLTAQMKRAASSSHLPLHSLTLVLLTGFKEDCDANEPGT